MATDTTRMLSDVQSGLQRMVTQFSETCFVSIQGEHESIRAAIRGLLQHLLQDMDNDEHNPEPSVADEEEFEELGNDVSS